MAYFMPIIQVEPIYNNLSVIHLTMDVKSFGQLCITQALFLLMVKTSLVFGCRIFNLSVYVATTSAGGSA